MGEMILPSEEMYVSLVRSSGGLAGVFEYTDHTGYFYLYDQTRKSGQRVVEAIHVISGEPDFSESDLEVRWTRGEDKVGLFIRGKLRAVFDERQRFGGDYRADARPNIPAAIVAAFGTTP